MAVNIDDALWKFSMDLFQLLCKNEAENVFVSPMSIMSALSMTLVGARGDTAKELQAALGLGSNVSDPQIHDQMGELQQSLTLSSAEVTSTLANKMFVEQSYEVLEEFANVLSGVYKAAHGKVDFMKNGKAAVNEINDWVERHTNNKITNLLSSSAVNALTRVILVNAIHFKGMWLKVFNKIDTLDQPFHITPSMEVKVPMMKKRDTKFHYCRSDHLQSHCVRLYFKNDRYALYLILPTKQCGLAEVEKKLMSEPQSLRSIFQRCRETKIDLLMLPRFRITSQFDLEERLPQLGILKLFDERNCDLSGISGNRDLFVSKVIHKAFLEVNEEGAEAAAATAVAPLLGGAPRMPERQPLHVIADHPFLVAICLDERPLFVGRINRPDLK